MAALRLAVLALAGAASVGAFSTSTSYCYDNDPFPEDCWANRPTTTEPCTVTSASTTCRCADESDNGCNIALTSDGETGRCKDILVYVGGEQAELHTSSAGVSSVGVAATSKEMFCQDMVRNDQWDELGLIATTDAAKPKEWWGWMIPYCPDGYTNSWWNIFRDTMCHRPERFLGETCGQLSFGVGTCQGSNTSYTEYSTSCYQGRCMPYAEVEARAPCECSWVGWNLFVVCSAAGDACDGHACVLNTGDGNKYCDYATSQDWQTVFSLLSR